jgi:hypothetical protein
MLDFITYSNQSNNALKGNKMQVRTEQIQQGGTSCGCGRSPTGKCCGWHALTEQAYRVKLNEYELEQYCNQAQELWSDSCTSGRAE